MVVVVEEEEVVQGWSRWRRRASRSFWISSLLPPMSLYVMSGFSSTVIIVTCAVASATGISDGGAERGRARGR